MPSPVTLDTLDASTAPTKATAPQSVQQHPLSSFQKGPAENTDVTCFTKCPIAPLGGEAL